MISTLLKRRGDRRRRTARYGRATLSNQTVERGYGLHYGVQYGEN